MVLANKYTSMRYNTQRITENRKEEEGRKEGEDGQEGQGGGEEE